MCDAPAQNLKKHRIAASPRPCVFCGSRNHPEPLTANIARCPHCRFFVPETTASAGPGAIPARDSLDEPRIGTRLRDRYRLISPLGEGAHGVTFRAEHEFLKHPCVVKLLPQRVSGVADDAAQRLHAEAAAGFRVNDAHVVRVLDCDVYNGLWYFVMEYVDGFDFATLLSAGLTPHWRQTVRIAIDAARGLAAIHAAGLVHRDVKPANLILGKDGKTRVADLGVAGLIETSAVQGTSESFGTLAYAAPEVFIPHDPVDLRADLYSLGAAMFELLTGQPPHAGAGVCQAVLSVSTRRMHWPEDAPQEIPTWVRETVLQLLE